MPVETEVRIEKAAKDGPYREGSDEPPSSGVTRHRRTGRRVSRSRFTHGRVIRSCGCAGRRGVRLLVRGHPYGLQDLPSRVLLHELNLVIVLRERRIEDIGGERDKEDDAECD